MGKNPISVAGVIINIFCDLSQGGWDWSMTLIAGEVCA